MKSVRLPLAEIRERRVEALQAGHHHVVRLWEELEARATSGEESNGGGQRERRWRSSRIPG